MVLATKVSVNHLELRLFCIWKSTVFDAGGTSEHFSKKLDIMKNFKENDVEFVNKF